MQKQFSLTFEELGLFYEFYIRVYCTDKFISYVGVIQCRFLNKNKNDNFKNSYEKSFVDGVRCEDWLLEEALKIKEEIESK